MPTRRQHSPQVRIPIDIMQAARVRSVELTRETGEPIDPLDVLRAGARTGVARVTAADLRVVADDGAPKSAA
jgi:hypothetical protein